MESCFQEVGLAARSPRWGLARGGVSGGAGCALPAVVSQEPRAQAHWYLELYLKLLLLPGLLSNFLLSRGNLSPPMSNIFSASWKKAGIIRSKGKLLLPRFQKTEHVSRNESWLNSSWATQGLLKAYSQHFWEPVKHTLALRRPLPVGTPALCDSKVSLSDNPGWPRPGCAFSLCSGLLGVAILVVSLLHPGLQLYLVPSKQRVFPPSFYHQGGRQFSFPLI